MDDKIERARGIHAFRVHWQPGRHPFRHLAK